MKSGSCQFISGAEDGTVKIWGEVLERLLVNITFLVCLYLSTDPSSSKSPVHTLTPGGKVSV